MRELLQTKEVIINDKTFILSKFPAVAGREIIAKYPLSMVPKLGDYAVNEETMLKLMCFVGVSVNDKVMNLSNRALVDNHVDSWETLGLIEKAMLEYNCSFLKDGLISNLLGDLVQNIPEWISKMLMGLSEGLLEQVKPPSES